MIMNWWWTKKNDGGGEHRWNLSGRRGGWLRTRTNNRQRDPRFASNPTSMALFEIGKERRHTHIRKYLNPFLSNRLSLQAGPSAEIFPSIFISRSIIQKTSAENGRKLSENLIKNLFETMKSEKEKEGNKSSLGLFDIFRFKKVFLVPKNIIYANNLTKITFEV